MLNRDPYPFEKEDISLSVLIRSQPGTVYQMLCRLVPGSYLKNDIEVPGKRLINSETDSQRVLGPRDLYEA